MSSPTEYKLETMEPRTTHIDEAQSNSGEKGGEVATGYPEATPEEERELLRRINLTILPLMCFVFFLQYLDKQSLSYASVFGLIPDLHLTSVQLSWTGSIFYVGQLVAQYPFIYVMSRLHLTKFVGATIVIWGVVCMCLATPNNFAGFATVRFFLGFWEGAVSPAFVTLTSIWYRKHEHATRTGLWITMNGLAQTVGCFLMYGIGKNDKLALAPWRTLFLVCGAITTFAGILFYFYMPSGSNDAWFLTERQKQILSMRMAKDREGGDKTSFSSGQLKEALLDVKTWLVFWFGVLVTMQAPVLAFASLVISNIGYDRFETMLYMSPSGIVQIVLLWIGVACCMMFPRNRTYVALALILIPLSGSICLLKLSLEAGWGMIVASWLASCITCVWSILLSLTASNVKGNTKRAVVNCMFFMGYSAGSIAGPQLWTKPPRYFSGVVTSIATWCTLFVVIAAYRVICLRDNKARDERTDAANEGLGSIVLAENESLAIDLTDKQDDMFRYSV